MTRRFALAAAILLLAIGPAGATGPASDCPTPPVLLSIEPALTHVAAKIARGKALTIVAVGSSSTEGVGASAPGLSYPKRLEVELRNRFPQLDIRVLNRGKGGEDAPEELARLGRDVIAEDPDLVIWQIGTNALLRRLDPTIEEDVLRRGIALIRQSESDVVLMDMQYAPAVTARPAYAAMQDLIAGVAARARVGLFRRFDIMKHWHAALQPGAVPVIGPDGLHLTDRSYACLAAGLAEAIAWNWRTYQMALRSPGARVADLLVRTGPTGDPAAAEEP